MLNTKQAKSRKRGGGVTNRDNNKSDNNSKIRKYKDLIEGRFDVASVIYIDRKDDGNTIFGKAAEFSTRTINQPAKK